MAITATQLERRKTHIGSSDVAAILGVSPWTTLYDVWLQKTGQVEEERTAPWLTAGSFMEVGILDYAQHELGPLVRNQYRTAREFYLGANIDALLIARNEPVEGKNVGAWGPRAALFDTAEQDGVPEDVLVQCHVHMICATKDKEQPTLAHVPVCLAGNQLHIFRIEWDEQLGNAIKAACISFWEDHVLADRPPKDSLPSLDMLKRRRREAGKVVTIEPFLAGEWQGTQAKLAAAKKEFNELDQQVKTALGDGEIGEVKDIGKFTYFAAKDSRTADVDALKAASVWEKYSKPKRGGRRLYWKLNKSEKPE